MEIWERGGRRLMFEKEAKNVNEREEKQNKGEKRAGLR